MLDKVSLNQKIQNFIATNPSVEGMNQTQLISCLIENEIITLDELQELSLFASNQDYEALGLTLQNTKTINDVIQKGGNSEILFKSNDGKTYNLNKTIQNKINKLNKDLKKAEDSNGWIGKAWSWTKNVTGLGDSSNKVRDKQAHEQELLKQFTMDNPKKAEIFKELTGVDFTPEALEAFIKGELPLESEKALKGYKEGQEMATDITADIVSGIAAFGIYAAAVAAAPFTGGASIAVGVAAATASGALIKTGIKALDCVGNDKEYTSKDLVYDLSTGAISGLLAPVSAGAGGAVGKTVATKCGMQVLKSAGKGVTEEVVTTGFKQTLQHSMLNPGSYKYAGGSLLQKTGVYGAEIAVDAGGSGTLDGAFRAGINGNDVIEGATTGLFAGIFMGGVFKGIGGGWAKVKKAGKEEPSVKVHENDQINHILKPDEGVHLVNIQEAKLQDFFKDDFKYFEIDKTGQTILVTQNGQKYPITKNSNSSIYIEYSQVSSIDGTIIKSKLTVDNNGEITIEKKETSNSWGATDNDSYGIDLNFKTKTKRVIIDKNNNTVIEKITPDGVKSIETIDENGHHCKQIINPNGTIKNIKTITNEDGRTYVLISQNKIDTSYAKNHITTIGLDFDNGSIIGGHDIDIYRNIDNIRFDGISPSANISIIKEDIVAGSKDLPKTIKIRVEEPVNANSISRKELLLEYIAGPPAYYRTQSKTCDTNWKPLDKNGRPMQIDSKTPKTLMSHELIEKLLHRMNETPESCLTYYILTNLRGLEYQVFKHNNEYYLQQIKPDGTLLSFYPISKKNICDNYPEVMLDKIPVWQ